MISIRLVKRPRKSTYRCQGCKKPICGPHVYCYGGEEYGKPGAIRLCPNCALSDEDTIEEIREFAEEHAVILKPGNELERKPS